MSRLGRSLHRPLSAYAIQEAGSFELKARPSGREAADWKEPRHGGLWGSSLEEQRDRPGFHAFAELKGAAEAFDTLIASQLSPDVPDEAD